jgi:hypothetical protein
MLKNLQGEWKQGKNTVEMNLPVMVFEDEGMQIAYIPVLDISGYGKTEKEATDSLMLAVNEYLKYTVNKNTLAKDLKAHGWTIKKKTKPFIAPEITDLINKNEYLHDIVNTKPYSMKRMPVNIPQYA